MARQRRNIKYRFRFAVLGEGITEQYYLTHLKNKYGYNYSLRPQLFQDVGIEKAEGIIDELVSGGCDSIVFLTDYDIIVGQNKKDAFNNLVKKYAGNESILICDSMPSIEYWFLLHFVYTTKEFSKCEEVVVELKKYIKDYSKSGKYLKTDAWFNTLLQNNGLEKAKDNADKGLKEKVREGGVHFPYTKMHEAIILFDRQKKNK